ncbi:hypothetical protein [Natronorubrum sulfidifaciens]|uniref:Uncharacterized protein n=1 Tax=Natronorubrum sulfidifaciens JCM 14089 TaxID=1230460 RepID=L9W235_9EURY|nr:hypothetical protein [Natronorubrum sulfidifaciens]ELY43412.1 hypothetical protein C495_13541 [Natronorubrum sulfidifaciens JCM 14089]
MWPLDLYTVVDPTTLQSLGPLAIGGIDLETYRALSGLERVGVQFAATLVIALVVLGLSQGHGPRTVAKARRSPVISLCIGLPSLLVLAGVTGTGYLIIGTSLGTFFGVVLVIIGLTLLPILTVLGLVAIGHSIATRVGADRLWAGVLTGSVLAGLAGLSVVATVAVAVLAGGLGVGAGVRVLFGSSGTTSPDERTVPPANKI